MAQSDNTLGAPTEGLGQKVTFAFDPAQPVASPTGSYGQLRVGTSGGQVGNTNVQFTRPAPTEHPLVGMVMQFADSQVKRAIKDKQTSAYLSGMQKAAQGEAVTDIAKEQPWYSNIFGPSDVVEGARAYAVATKANTTIEAMREDMDRLKTMSPEQAKAHYNGMVQSAMTGDDVTDAQTMLHLTKELPVLEKQRMKAHYGYVQEQAAAAEHAYFRSNFTGLQSKAKAFADGTITEDEWTAAQDGFEAGFRPVPGRNIENWQANTAKILAEEAQAGNFVGLNALRRRDVGLMDALTPEGRVSVERAIITGEANLRSKYSYQWNDALATIEMQAIRPAEGETAETTAKRIDELNAQYKSETGSSQGLITPDKRAALLTGSYSAILRETEKQAAELQRRADRAAHAAERAADKAAARREKEQMRFLINAAGMQAFDTGSIGMFARTDGVNKEALDDSLYTQWLARGDKTGSLTQAQIAPLIAGGNSDYVNPVIKKAMVGSVTSMMGKEVLDQVGRATITNFKALYDKNPVVARAYFGEHAAALEGFLKDAATNGEQDAYHTNFVMSKRPQRTPEPELKAAASAMGADTSWVGRAWTGDVTIKPGQVARLTREVADYTDSIPSGIPLADRVKQAYTLARTENKVEVVGGYFLRVGKGQTSLQDYLITHAGPNDRPIANDQVHQVVEEALDAKLFGNNNTVLRASDMSNIAVDRDVDVNGKPQLRVTAIDKDGGRYDALISADDIYAQAALRRRDAELAPIDKLVNKSGGVVYRTKNRPQGELPFTQPLFPK